MTSAALLAFATTISLMIITPGPAVMQVTGHSISHGWKAAQASILGIVAANAMYCALSVLGLGALILIAPSVFEAVKWCGVSYLAWLGLKALYSAFRKPRAQVAPTRRAHACQLFRRSFILQGTNPKSVLFFCALLPVFAGEAAGAPARIALLGIIAILMEYPILLAYSLLAARVRRWVSESAGGQRLLDGLSGVALLAAAGTVGAETLDEH